MADAEAPRALRPTEEDEEVHLASEREALPLLACAVMLADALDCSMTVALRVVMALAMQHSLLSQALLDRFEAGVREEGRH